MKKVSEITQLRNLGPVSEGMLNSVGIYTREDLEKLGAKVAFEKVKKAGLKPSLNLMYAMEGAIHNMSWKEVVGHLKSVGIIKSKNKF